MGRGKRILVGRERKESEIQFLKTIEIAKNATCLRWKCGVRIIKNGLTIGEGFNSPPGNLESQRRCLEDKKNYWEGITDKTCCIHAEQRGVVDALIKNPGKLEGSILYFMRLDLEDNFLYAGDPYCTICSKFVLDSGVKEFVLWHKEGIFSYETEFYNDISFRRA